MAYSREEVISNETIARGKRIINSLSPSEEDAVYFMDDEKFFDVLNVKVNVDRVGALKGNHGVTSDYLSQKWLTSPEASKKTVHHTTQRSIRTVLHMSLPRRFKRNY